MAMSEQNASFLSYLRGSERAQRGVGGASGFLSYLRGSEQMLKLDA